jgi:hypothetical protein
MSNDKVIKVAVLTPGSPEFVWRNLTANLKTLQTLVGGRIERVPVPETEEEASIYINEEGKLDNLPVSAIWWFENKPYDLLRGTIVICGSDDSDGSDADLTPELLAKIRQYVTPFSQK